MVETNTTETIRPTTKKKNAKGPGLTNVSSNKNGSSARHRCQREKVIITQFVPDNAQGGPSRLLSRVVDGGQLAFSVEAAQDPEVGTADLCNGSTTAKVVPLPRALETSMRPWWSSTIRRAKDNPRPVPSPLVV